MRKKMIICGKEYDICSNAFTMFLYKKEFNTGIMTDISRLQDFNIKQEEISKQMVGKSQDEIDKEVGLALMPEVDTFTEIAFRLAYVFIKCANPNFVSFDEWTNTIDNFSFLDPWISEVTELAVNSFCGQGVNRPGEIAKK